MATESKPLEELVKQLPIDLQQEVRDLVEFLMERRSQERQHGEIKISWRGALRDMRDQFTSTELQH